MNRITFNRNGKIFQNDILGMISIPLAPFLTYNTILPIIKYETNPITDLQL